MVWLTNHGDERRGTGTKTSKSPTLTVNHGIDPVVGIKHAPGLPRELNDSPRRVLTLLLLCGRTEQERYLLLEPLHGLDGEASTVRE